MRMRIIGGIIQSSRGIVISVSDGRGCDDHDLARARDRLMGRFSNRAPGSVFTAYVADSAVQRDGSSSESAERFFRFLDAALELRERCYSFMVMGQVVDVLNCYVKIAIAARFTAGDATKNVNRFEAAVAVCTCRQQTKKPTLLTG
jgi:hypothetical protein